MKLSFITTPFYFLCSLVLFSLAGLGGVATAQSAFPGGTDIVSKPVSNIGRGAETFGTLVSLGTTIAVSLAFFFFFWNLFKFIRAGDPEDKKSAQNMMIWSIVAIIIIVSLWGIIGFVRSVFGIDSGEKVVNPVVVPPTVFPESN